MNIVALIMAITMAITPIVSVVDVDNNIVYVDVSGEIFSFYGEGFSVDEEIRILFVNDMILEVFPW